MLARLLLALVGFLVFALPAYSASLVFRSPVHIQSHGSQSVAIADVDGDGRDDLIALARPGGFNANGKLDLFLQQNDGSLAPPQTVATPSFATVVKATRLRAGGGISLLVGHDQGLSVYGWNGAGGLFLDHEAGDYPCLNMAVADLDADGAMDVVCLGRQADAMLLHGDSSGFGPPRYFQTAAMDAGSVGQVQLKDVTSDGRPDLLLAAGAANSFFVYPNDGARGFLPAVAYPYPLSYLWSVGIEALDVDHDGANEVFVSAPCNIPCATLHRYRQGPHGYLELSLSTPTFESPGPFFAADVDSDGFEDLLLSHTGWSTIGRYMGRPQGLALSELWSSVPLQHGSNRLAVGDLDHDGHSDMAVANSFGVSLLYGGLQAASDFDNDFRSDLVWRNGAGETLIWMSANHTTSRPAGTKAPDWLVQAIGDFDGDAEADLFWRDQSTGSNEIWSGGNSSLGNTTAVTSQSWQVTGAGDFNGDGRSDLLWRNFNTGANAIWYSGEAALSQAIAAVADQRWKVAGVGDFDGDRRADILWRHAITGRNVIWRSGSNGLELGVTAVPNMQWGVAGLGDFNGDGHDDIAWRNSSTGSNEIWLSARSQTPMAVTAVPNLDWMIGAVADYDGDARADLLWRNRSTGANTIWYSANSRQSQAIATVRGWDIVR